MSPARGDDGTKVYILPIDKGHQVVTEGSHRKGYLYVLNGVQPWPFPCIDSGSIGQLCDP